MSEIEPVLLTRSEIEWLLGKTTHLSKKVERDLRYQINKKVRKIFIQTELPLLKNRGFAADIGNDDAAISGGGSGGCSTGERSLVGRGIDNNQQITRKNGAGSGNFVPF
jgi:hypothetical protein